MHSHSATTDELNDELAALVTRIDREHLYPKTWLHAFGNTGGFAVADETGAPDFITLFWQQYQAARLCTTTAFCVWCQSACAWYLYNTKNNAVRERYFRAVSRGERMGATGLSNPMKALADMETIRLKARRTSDGYVVDGALPWVSNLERGTLVGAVCEVDTDHSVFALIDTSDENVTLTSPLVYAGLNGSATVSLRLTNYLLTDDMVISDDASSFLTTIRPGFILLQLQMAHGAIDNCLSLLQRKVGNKPWVATGLPHTPEELTVRHKELLRTTEALLADPYATEPSAFTTLLQHRLAVSLLTLDAAQMLLLGAGGSGFVLHSEANRRWRDSHFVALITPSVTQLYKMLGV